jgi:hypothetical protein
MPFADTNGSNGATSIPDSHIVGGHPKARPRLTKPLVYSGSLDRFTRRDLTPVIGREYEGLQVTELLEANNEQLIKDFACTGALYGSKSAMHVLTEPVSQRGVVFLRNQDVTPQQMKELCLRITEAAGSVCDPFQTFNISIILNNHKTNPCHSPNHPDYTSTP